MVPAFAVIAAFSRAAQPAVCRPGGGMGGRGGPGGEMGGGDGRMQQMEQMCEQNPDMCELMKQTSGFCSVNRDLCSFGSDGAHEPANYSAVMASCNDGGTDCAEIKAGLQNNLDRLNELKQACQASDAECSEMKNLITVCKEDAEQCGEIEAMKERCAKSPDVCKRNIQQKRDYCGQRPSNCDGATLRMLDEMEEDIAQME